MIYIYINNFLFKFLIFIINFYLILINFLFILNNLKLNINYNKYFNILIIK